MVERKDEVVAGSEPIELEFRRWTVLIPRRIPVSDSGGRFGQALRNGENHCVARECIGGVYCSRDRRAVIPQHDVQCLRRSARSEHEIVGQQVGLAVVG